MYDENGKEHIFGGDWTEKKLDIIEEYLRGYLIALQYTPFIKGYIDAFAGTGYRKERKSQYSNELHFPELAHTETQKLLDGSARRALNLDRQFDKYIFIEKDKEKCHELKKLKQEYSDIEIRIEEGDANRIIVDMCQKDWSKHRAVMFLDPYGLQVEWETIEAIAKTRAIDLWILFPIGPVNRMITRSGEIPSEWERRLNTLLGTGQWRDEFYEIEESRDLLGKTRTVKKREGIITEDEHRVLQLGTDIGVNKYVILPPTKGAMWQGRAELETGTSSVQGATTAITTDAPTGVISASAAVSCSTIVLGGVAMSCRRRNAVRLHVCSGSASRRPGSQRTWASIAIRHIVTTS